MMSGTKRRAELKAKRKSRAAKAEAVIAAAKECKRLAILAAKEHAGVIVNPEKLAPYNSYGQPEFVERGYYVDQPFRCDECGCEELWTATQQKWWFEVAKGYVYSTAKLCRACRRRERDRRSKARRVHQEGLARKKRGTT